MVLQEKKFVLTPEQREAMSLANIVRLVDIYALGQVDESGSRPQLQKLMARLEERLPKLSDAVSSRFLIHAGLPRHFGSSVDGSHQQYVSK